jgi:hypothetical protein
MSIFLPNYSARDTAITQRPTSSAILGIDSEDRYKDYLVERLLPSSTAELNATPYDFTIQKQQPLLNGAFSRIAVTEVNFQYAVPNINPKTNKIQMYYKVGAAPASAPVTLQLPPGFYTPAQIASQIQNLVRAVDIVNLGAFQMTYGTFGVGPTAGTFPLFAYRTNAAGVLIGFIPMTPATSTFPAYAQPNIKQLFDLLGFHGTPPPLTILDPPADGNCALIDDYYGSPTFCQSTRYIDIVCSQLTNNQAVKDGMSQPITRDILCRLYLASPSDPINVSPASSTFCPPGCAPFTLYRDFSTAKQIQWMPNCPMSGYLRFEVFDDAGELLAESDPAQAKTSINWSMTLLATEN